MEHKNKLSDTLAYFQSKETHTVNFQESAIEQAYMTEAPKQTLPIKVLSILGGLLTAIAFFGFLLITGFYQSGIALTCIGVLAISAGAILSQKHDSILLDTISISSVIIGFILVGVGMAELDVSEKTIPLFFITIALLCFFLAKSYMLTFVSTLIAHGSIFAYLMSSNQPSLIPIYVALLGILIGYVYLKEAKLIGLSTFMARRYNPLKIALIFAFVSGLMFLRGAFLPQVHPYFLLVTSTTSTILILYVTHTILNVFAVTKWSTKSLAYFLTLLTLAPTAVTPGISGALLLLLLGFLTNYKTGFVIGGISLLYFIGQCYYDLQFTLLTKSILLFASGIFFLVLYLFIAKRHEQH